MKNEYVHHPTLAQNLLMISPHITLKEEKVTYAYEDRNFATLFLGDQRRCGAQLGVKIGRDENTGLPFALERFSGALRLKYSSPSSMYLLPKEFFDSPSTDSGEKFISRMTIPVIDEFRHDYPLDTILSLSNQGRILVIPFSEKNDFDPNDDEEIIKCVVKSAIKYNRMSQYYIAEKFHPRLMQRIGKELKRTEETEVMEPVVA